MDQINQLTICFLCLNKRRWPSVQSSMYGFGFFGFCTRFICSPLGIGDGRFFLFFLRRDTWKPAEPPPRDASTEEKSCSHRGATQIWRRRLHRRNKIGRKKEKKGNGGHVVAWAKLPGVHVGPPHPRGLVGCRASKVLAREENQFDSDYSLQLIISLFHFLCY